MQIFNKLLFTRIDITLDSCVYGTIKTCSIVLAHVIVVDALTIAVLLMIQDLSCLLVDELVEENCKETGAKWNRRVQVDRVPRREPIAEERGHLNTDSDGGVHHCAK